ncbi:MAG TPA: hypothetical protein PLX31_21700 [Gemmatimonadaceae bacterium]|nr:hypothetical protein [Gemmatimonadaceae bacterium]
MRTRDVGFATVDYSNGLTLGALTLTETLALERASGSLFATGLVSLFNDGRWSMQGGLTGSRFSAPIAAGGILRPWFRAVRGELSLNTTSTAQQGFMPTLQLLSQARLHLLADDYSMRGGAAITRTFDGFAWRTTVLGDAGGWARVGDAVVSYTATPMQLQYGDVLGDNEATVSWSRGRVTYDASLGVRLGEAQQGTAGWGSLTTTWSLRAGALATASVGSYPIDLIQGLPGGRYAAFALRLPAGGLKALRARPARPLAPPPPERPELPITERLALVIGPPLDSLSLREVRVWAPGIRTVELLGDFTEWVPVPLIRQPNGEWRGYYHVTPGIHRINLRLNREEFDVPVNLAKVKDEFTGDVGLIIVR